jgi:hypothetical protein
MGFVSGINDFVFPPGEAFRFGNLDFITNDFGKISLLESDSNQSGRGQISAPFGYPELDRGLPQDHLHRVGFKPLGRDPIYFKTTQSRRWGLSADPDETPR